ncbi:unnamed protein product [Tuber melanosporum]|uniref:(Perigord truffle) hypothetical protein n=1 Tax=Tuber melanosporum (strain Mel28) TaxID=656061 RepID=D5G8E2_TUBMM|nr:uncharacterized protein GSTUM_00004776001 [Tuber melanosporum]CAZ80785.1 unnamed protein product [Tuber melanosporum]
MPNRMEPEVDELTEDEEEAFLSPLQTSDLAPSSHVGDEEYLPESREDVGKVDSQDEQQIQHRKEELSSEQTSSNMEEEDQDDDAPYAVLIYRALMSTPTRRMVLSQIYDYFREKIPKFRKIKGRGWMNSIRHNLSMNGAFLKEDRPPSDPGKGYIWVLSKEAEMDGVKSTTRYRKSPPNAKKRATDEFYLRGSTVKRRRKSTRKGTASKPASSPCPSGSIGPMAEHGGSESQQAHEGQSIDSPTLPEGFFKREENDTQPVGIHIFDDQDHSGLAAMYTSDERMLLAQATRGAAAQQVDYSTCYSSFPHSGTSQTLYNSEDDGLESLEEDCWQFCGNNDGSNDGNRDNFSEEFTLVTQK